MAQKIEMKKDQDSQVDTNFQIARDMDDQNDMDEDGGRKLFQNKKLNIVLIAIAVILVVAFIGLNIWVNIPA